VSLPLLTSAKKGLRGEAEDRPLMAQEDDMRDQEIRAALDRHWAASDASDFEAEHRIYREDAVLQYPQSGERIRGRRNIQITRANQPSKKRFAVRRVIGSGDLWSANTS
jgi:ketosteroid isomerase-like protein